MSFSYDPTDLDTSTASGRLNIVRYLTGDTVEVEAKNQDEEINFLLTQASDNSYLAASYAASATAASYAQLVNAEVDGQLSEDLSDLYSHYNKLSAQLKQMASNVTGMGMALKAGGLTKTQIDRGRCDPNRVKPSFYIGQFEGSYSDYEPFEDDD